MQDDVVDGRRDHHRRRACTRSSREAGESELRIEIAPGVVVTLDRRAVAAVAGIDERPTTRRGDETPNRSAPRAAAAERPDAS